MKCAVRAITKYCTPGVNVSQWYPKHSQWYSRWVPGNGNKLIIQGLLSTIYPWAMSSGP